MLTCIDSRIDPLAMLGLEPGDAKIIRNAGARVTDDVLTTLVVARYLLDVERFMVIAHTDCRMVAGSDDELRTAIRESGGPETSDLSFSTSADQAASVRADVERVRSFEPPRDAPGRRLRLRRHDGLAHRSADPQSCGMISAKRAPFSIGS